MNRMSDGWSRARACFLEDDASYFRRRAAQERTVAFDAYDPRVRQVHLDMAERYDDLARAVLMFERHLEHQFETVM